MTFFFFKVTSDHLGANNCFTQSFNVYKEIIAYKDRIHIGIYMYEKLCLDQITVPLIYNNNTNKSIVH